MWQLWFLYWSSLLSLLIVSFSPNIPTGQFQSIWLAVPVCACPLAHADLLSKNWAGGHWLWITKGYSFINILLLSSLDPPAAPPSVTCLSLSSSSQCGLPFLLLLPLLSHKPDFFVLCHAGLGVHPASARHLQGLGTASCSHLQCCAGLQHTSGRLKGWLHPQALVFMTKCRHWKQCSWRGVILTQAMPCLLGVLMLVIIFIQEGG